MKNEVKDLGGLDFVSAISPAAGMIPTDGVTRVEVGQPIGASTVTNGLVWMQKAKIRLKI